MGYRYLTLDDLISIFRRWHAGHSLSSMKQACGFDRNTIRNYCRLFESAGYSPDCELPQGYVLIEQFHAMLPLHARPRSIRKVFENYKDEILELVTRKKEPVKPKTAFLVIKQKYDLPGSYETFKLFMREQGLRTRRKTAPLRIELPPGREIQLDYGQVGRLYDPETKRNRVVWAFCAKLSFSRLPFIEFVFSQNQEDFVASNIAMVEFFGGTTDFISIDNLKAGVIKPDLYEPKLNRAYVEFAEHYGTFINPCRVGKSTDKAKVERMVPQGRELFRRLKEVHPAFSLKELNEAARAWCLEEYGRKKHGTTGVAPMELFEEEREYLKELSAQRFEVPVWKTVVVGEDRFFAFHKKYYAMPDGYRGKKVNVRKTGNILRVFSLDHALVREYIVAKRLFSTLPGDFSEDREALMKGAYPRWLLGRARRFGPTTERLIQSVLISHAYINARRARGILEALEKYKTHPFLQEICGRAIGMRIYRPKQIVQMLEAGLEQSYFDFIIPTSETGKAMIRDVNEYFN